MSNTFDQLHNDARKRVETMGFSEADKALIFYDWSDIYYHVTWLLSASRKEIDDWLGWIRYQIEH